MSVGINPPKSPVTKGSSGIATATIPNVCKMPGPPAPFVPTPLPNIGKSGDSPDGYSSTVKIEGNPVAIQGASFGSMGDMASKGTGGGLISSNTHGPCKFIGPGSMDVKIEGKNVQLLSDPMLNNCGPGGSPANSATMLGIIQGPELIVVVPAGKCPLCDKDHGALKQSDESKASAEDLAEAFEKILEVNGWSHGTMIGVVLCADRKYADQSGPTLKEFVDLLKGYSNPPEAVGSLADWGAARKAAGKARKKRHEDFKKSFGKTAAGKDALTVAQSRVNAFLDDDTKPAAYPIGSCAGQKALVRALDDRAQVVAMTERWSSKQETGGQVQFIDQDTSIKYHPKIRKTQRPFKPGESVPPCNTCDVILPFLLCPGDKEPKCSH